MRAFGPIPCLILLAHFLLSPAVRASAPPEWRMHDEGVGQESQRLPSAALHPDGTWTVAWIDYRTGYPSVQVRSFNQEDAPLGPAAAVTDGYGLYRVDVNPTSVADPRLASLGTSGMSALVWTEVRKGVPRVRAALVGPEGLIQGPVTVDSGSRPTSKKTPFVAVSGQRFLVLWTEGEYPLRPAYGQVYGPDLIPVGGNFLLDADADDIQDRPRAAASPQGWIVAWSGQSLAGSRVLVRPFDLNGQPLSGARLVESDGQALQEECAIIPIHNPVYKEDPTGYFVAWTRGSEGRVSLIGRTLDTSLNPIADPFPISTVDDTVTPREPELLDLGGGSVLVFWTAGDAQHSRFHARTVTLPSTPSGAIVVVDDPPSPPGLSIVPRGLSVIAGSTDSARLLWHDARDGWDVVYEITTDAVGQATSSPTPVDAEEGTASQVFPDVVLFSDHRGAAVWEDFRSGSLGIYGVFLDGEGKPEGGAFRISEIGGGTSSPADNMLELLRNRPVLGATKNGSLVAAWTISYTNGTRNVFQIYDPSGIAVGGNILLPTACGIGPQGQPAFAATIDGGFYLVWWESCGSDYDVLAQHFLADGNVDGDTIRVVDRAYQGASQINPVASSGEGGETVIAWLDDRGGNYDIYAQRLGPTGLKIGQNVPISPPEEGGYVVQTNPDVAAQADRYVVVYDEEPFAGGGVVGLLSVLPSMKDAGGIAEETYSFQIGTGASGMKYPRVAMAPDGRFVVAYWDISGDSARVMAQRFDARAARIGAPYSVTSMGGKVLSLPGGVAADGGRIRFTFADDRDHRGWDARVRTVGWTYDGGITPVAVAGWTIAGDQDALLLRWSIPRDHAGAFYRVWREEGAEAASGSPGGAATLLTQDPVGPTLPGGVEYAFRDDTAAPGTLYVYWIQDDEGEFAGPWAGMRSGRPLALDLRAADNPFSASTRLSWSQPRAGESEVAVFDLSGRLVRTLLPSRRRAAGSGDLAWDGRDEQGRDLPPGVYWARLQVRPVGERTVKLLRLR